MNRSMIAILAGLAFGWSGATALAAEASTAPRATETLKERLSDKASDDQRVNNCHVPPERRGTKPRPVDCTPGASASSNPSPPSAAAREPSTR